MPKILLVCLIAIAAMFRVGGHAEAATAGRYLPLSVILAERGIVIGDTSNGISARTDWYCTSTLGYRVYGGKTLVYHDFLFFPWEQVKLAREGFGELMVYKGTTRCNPGEVPEVVWDRMRYINMYAPHPTMVPILRIAQKQFETNPTATTIYCRSNWIGFAWDFSIGDPRTWKTATFSKKIVALSLREGTPELKPLTPTMFWLRSNFQIWGTYVSRDWKCSEDLVEIQKGGYRLLTW